MAVQIFNVYGRRKKPTEVGRYLQDWAHRKATRIKDREKMSESHGENEIDQERSISENFNMIN